jgi:hypothetical protein
MHEGEELAIVVEFNENGEPLIQSYVRPRHKVFDPTEVREAYISASTSKEIQKDKAAAALFQDFRNGGKQKSDNGKTYEVFTWSNAE